MEAGLNPSPFKDTIDPLNNRKQERRMKEKKNKFCFVILLDSFLVILIWLYLLYLVESSNFFIKFLFNSYCNSKTRKYKDVFRQPDSNSESIAIKQRWQSPNYFLWIYPIQSICFQPSKTEGRKYLFLINRQKLSWIQYSAGFAWNCRFRTDHQTS